MFQGMATGHPGLGTLHADSVSAVIDRLTTKPINLPLPMLANLDIIVFLTLQKRGNLYVRRVKEMDEVLGYNREKKELNSNKIFEWNPYSDRIIFLGSKLLNRIMERMGYTKEQLEEDLKRRIKVLNWMVKNDISDYREISRIVNLYYIKPKRVLEMIGGA